MIDNLSINRQTIENTQCSCSHFITQYIYDRKPRTLVISQPINFALFQKQLNPLLFYLLITIPYGPVNNQQKQTRSQASF